MGVDNPILRHLNPAPPQGGDKEYLELEFSGLDSGAVALRSRVSQVGLDEVAFQTRFVSSAARRLIIGHQAGDASIVCPDLPNWHLASHTQRSQSSGCFSCSQ